MVQPIFAAHNETANGHDVCHDGRKLNFKKSSHCCTLFSSMPVDEQLHQNILCNYCFSEQHRRG